MLWEVFKSFYSIEEAERFKQLLSQNGIECKIEKTKQVLDKVIIGDDVSPGFHLKMSPQEFNHANQIIDQEILQQIGQIDHDYYLFEFENKELVEILQKPDEWSNQDVVIARKILSDRGYELTDLTVEKYKRERLLELATPTEEKTASLWRGYLLAIFLPLPGIIYSLYLMTEKKLLPDGSKTFAYTQNSRGHFQIMLVISILISLVYFFGFQLI